MSKFVPIPSFDGLSPQTTKGDTISRSTTGAVRVPVGADGTVMTADSTQTSGIKWASASGNQPVNTLVGATTLPAVSQTILASGTTFAITLPSPTGNSGLEYRILKTDAGLITPISISGTGFIGASMATQNEEYRILCDGATYWPIEHQASTLWSSPTTSTLVSTSGVKGTGTVVDSIQWRREGAYARIRFAYSHTVAGTAATDAIKLSVPLGLLIDTANTGTNTIATMTAQFSGGAFVLSNSYCGLNVSTLGGGAGGVCVFGSTQVRLWANIAGSGPGFWGTVQSNLNNAAVSIFAEFLAPIQGWAP